MTGVTIKDVAQRAGVALGTVSRILNGNSTVAAHLRERVEAVIEELGYRPSATARSMRSRRTQAVGCVVSDIAQPVAASMLGGAEGVLREGGYAMIVVATHYDEAREAAALAFMEERGVDGLLIAVNRDASAATADRLAALPFPVVLWERDVGGRFDAVITEHEAGVAAAMRHLIALGHRDIAIIAAQRETLVGRAQEHAHAAALREIGRKPRRGEVLYTDLIDAAAIAALLGRPRRPSAIIANIHDIPAILKTAHAASLAVPADVSLISIGDSDVLEVLTPPVTAIRGAGARVGAAAADLLMRRMREGPGAVAHRIDLQTELVVRRSCQAITPGAATI